MFFGRLLYLASKLGTFAGVTGRVGRRSCIWGHLVASFFGGSAGCLPGGAIGAGGKFKIGGRGAIDRWAACVRAQVRGCVRAINILWRAGRAGDRRRSMGAGAMGAGAPGDGRGVDRRGVDRRGG